MGFKPWVYFAGNWLTKHVLVPPCASVTVQGLDNLPLSGPLIIATNHLGDSDPGILGSSIPRRIVFLAKIELFKVPIFKQFMIGYGAIPVHRNQADLTALRAAAEALEQGLALGVFPEGTASEERAQMREAWPGVGLLALRNHVPVLPIAITGSQRLGVPKMFLHPRPFNRDRVLIRIGEPFLLPKPDMLNAEAARAATRTIMERIAALLPESYRGYYGSAVEAPAAEKERESVRD